LGGTQLPTYEYKCPNCGCFEAVQRITEEALTVCPTCGSTVRRLMPHKVFIAFKGPGFHVNDYPSHGQKGAAETEEKLPTPAGSGDPKAGPAEKPKDNTPVKPAASGS
jgi:putative FmdB family regulatory protein